MAVKKDKRPYQLPRLYKRDTRILTHMKYKRMPKPVNIDLLAHVFPKFTIEQIRLGLGRLYEHGLIHAVGYGYWIANLDSAEEQEEERKRLSALQKKFNYFRGKTVRSISIMNFYPDGPRKAVKYYRTRKGLKLG
jgi:hypothetical protein